MLRGDITTGKVIVAVRPYGASADYVSDAIDQTAIREVTDETGSSYSYVARFDAGPNALVALKADANFTGSVTAQVTADLVG